MDLLAVDQCLVYGLESTKLAALRQVCTESKYALTALPSLEKVGTSTPKAFTLSRGSYSVKLLFIRHPSAYFSWKGWARIIRTAMVLEHFRVTS